MPATVEAAPLKESLAVSTTALTSLPLPAAPRRGGRGRVPGNLGIWAGICCEFIEFSVLFTVYFVARSHAPEAFHAGAQRLSQTAGVVITLLMITSSALLACAVASLRAGRRRESQRWLMGALLVALGYPVVKLLEFHFNLSQGLGVGAGLFFTVYYYLCIAHMIHAVWGIMGMCWALARHLGGAYTPEQHEGLEALASYWHATDLVWLAIFPFFYVLV